MKANFLSDFWEAVDLWVAVATDSMSHLVSKVFQYFQNLEFPRDYYIILCVFCLLIVPCVKKSGILKKITSKIKNLKQTNPKLRWLWGLKWPIIIVSFVLFWPVYYALFIIQLIGYFGLFKGNKIKRHRDLFSKDGYPLLGLSAKFAFIVPITLWIVVTVISRFNSEYMEQSLIHDDYKIFEIICQYLDPGNVANSQGLGSGIALISALLGIVCLSGFLVSAIVNVISQTRIQWQKGLINYNGVKKFKEYVVIIGINEQTASIARSALDSDDNRYVLIQTRQDVEKVRPELESKIDDDKQDRIVYYAGDRTSYEDIEKLHLEKAIEVYILGESVENSDKKKNDDQLEKEHDAYNISCLEHISECRKKYVEKENKEEKPRLNVHVQFDYQSTFTAFKATHLYQKLGRNIRFIPFNIYELWAKKVLVDNLAIYPAGNKTELKVQRYNPIDTYIDKVGKRIKVDDKKTVHLIIIGMNQMGTALATQAALLCHFPNFATDKSKKTVITFIDDNAISEAEYYMGRYSTLFKLSHYRIVKLNGDEANSNEFNWKTTDPFKTGKYNHLITKADKEIITVKKDDKEETIEKPCLLDVEWEFIQGNAASKPVQDYIKEIVGNEQKIVTIAICFNDSQQSLASAMYLPKTVYDHCNQVLVYQRSIFDVANDVARGDSDWRRYQHLFPFGMSEASYTENPFDSHLAALDYYLYEKEEMREPVKKYFDSDKTDKDFESSFLKNVDDAWENAGIVRKTASIDSVDSIPFKLRSMGIEYCRDLDKIEEKISKEEYKKIKEGIVEAEHNRWTMQMLISGFCHLSSQEQEACKQPDLSHEQELEKELKELISKKENLSESEKSDIVTKSEELIKLKDKRDKLNVKLRIIRKNHPLERKDLSICSFKRMKEVHMEGVKKDELVIKMIPYLLRGNELLNALILRDTDGRYTNSSQRKVLEKFFQYDTKQQDIKAFLYLKKKIVEKGDDEKYCKHGFWMAVTAVTREQWYHVTGKKPKGFEKGEKLPVVLVSKKEVDDFIDILRKESGLYFDLPSLKEWETAASPKKLNDEGDNWDVNKEFVTKESKCAGPREVRSDEKKGRFLHHMFGNVWEWTRKKDKNHEFFKFAGGSWRFTKKECEINDKNYWWHAWDTDSKSDDLGFRLVWKYDRNVLTLTGNENMECDSKNSSNSSEDDFPDVEAIKEWFERDKHKFVRVENGYFVMGADKDPAPNGDKSKETDNNDKSKEPDNNEGPRHSVHISKTFYMCKVPVTQSLWNAVMNVKKPRLNPTTNRIGDEIPQTDISWKGDGIEPGVEEFLKTLNESLNQETICEILKIRPEEIEKDHMEFRLPTEAEWEYAAKGGRSAKELKEKDLMDEKENYYSIKEDDFKDKKGNYYSIKVDRDEDGNLIPDKNELYKRNDVKYPLFAGSDMSDNVYHLAWFKQPSIHEVAEKLPNKLGLYDMSGNVWEWCYDFYIADMYERCKLGDDSNIQEKEHYEKDEYKKKGYITDPVALDDSYSAHVFRGGSWRSSEWDCRCTRANYWGENYKANDLGFRLVVGRPIVPPWETEKKAETEKPTTADQQ